MDSGSAYHIWSVHTHTLEKSPVWLGWLTIAIFLITNETFIFETSIYTVTILHCIVTEMFAKIKISSARV